jgi:hypothetical protein
VADEILAEEFENLPGSHKRVLYWMVNIPNPNDRRAIAEKVNTELHPVQQRLCEVKRRIQVYFDYQIGYGTIQLLVLGLERNGLIDLESWKDAGYTHPPQKRYQKNNRMVARKKRWHEAKALREQEVADDESDE